MPGPRKFGYQKGTEMARLSKQQVKQSKLRTEEFEVPEWGGSILLGEWPAGRTGEIMAMFQGADSEAAVASDPAIMVKLFVMGCIDPVFGEEDIPDLLESSGAVLMRASQRIMFLNGLTNEALDEARGKS